MAAPLWLLWAAGIVLFQFAVSYAPTHGKALSVAHFPRRDALHLQRKAQHALTGLLFYVVLNEIPAELAAVVLFVAAAAFYGVHRLRKRSPRADALYLASFRGILRQDEAAKRVLPGAFYFVLGSALTLALFPLGIARLAIVHLSVGDPAASLCGTLFHRHTPRAVRATGVGANKSLAGFVGALLAAGLASFVVLHFGDPGNRGSDSGTSIEQSTPCVSALYAGVAAALAEFVSVGGWDDNLSLPLLSALLLQLGSSTLGLAY